MATNYQKWEKWDVKEAEEASEKAWEVDELEEETRKEAARLRQATSTVRDSTLRSAQALQSKVFAIV